MPDDQDEKAPADEPKKLTAKEQIAELEARLQASNEALETATRVLQGQETRLNAIEARLDDAPADEPVDGIELPIDPNAPRRRAFVCPQGPNVSYLIHPGVTRQIKDGNSPTGFRDAARDGDVMLRFKGGIWESGTDVDADEVVTFKDSSSKTYDEARITYCEAHPEKIRDVEDSTTDIWFSMKQGQMVTSRREASFSPSINVDKAIAGEVQELVGTGESLVQRTQKRLVAERLG